MLKKDYKQTEKYAKKTNQRFLGHRHSEKTRIKISKNNKGKHSGTFSEEHKRKIKENHVGSLGKHWKQSEKTIKARREKMIGKHWKIKDTSNMKKSRTIEHRKNIGKASIKRWQDSIYREKILSNLLKSKDSPNKTERHLNVILQQILPDEYKYVGDGEFILAGKYPDFININKKKKLIELYGDYWHRNDDPQNRIDLFKKHGYNTLIIWEKELEDLKKMKQRILSFNHS